MTLGRWCLESSKEKRAYKTEHDISIVSLFFQLLNSVDIDNPPLAVEFKFPQWSSRGNTISSLQSLAISGNVFSYGPERGKPSKLDSPWSTCLKCVNIWKHTKALQRLHFFSTHLLFTRKGNSLGKIKEKFNPNNPSLSVFQLIFILLSAHLDYSFSVLRNVSFGPPLSSS